MTNNERVWAEKTVGELCLRVTSGGTPSRSNSDFYLNGTVPWIKTAELQDGYVTKYDEYISTEAIANSSAKILPKNTVLMAMYGATVGMLGILSEPATCNQAACAMVVDREKADPRWLFYALKNDREHIVSRANGAAQQNLSGGTIRGLSFIAPGLMEQQAIAEVLGALDNKIAANTKMIATLDQIFMVRWQAVSQNNSTAGATLQSLIEESIGGDWGTDARSLVNPERVRCIRGADIAKLQNYQPAKMPERFLKPASLDRRKTRHGDIAVEMSGGSPTQSTGRVALITDHLLKRIDSPIVSSNFCRVLRLTDPIYAIAVYAQLRQDWTRGEFFQYENGSTGIKNLAFNEYAARQHVPELSRDELRTFNHRAEGLQNCAYSLGDENRTLAETRDALLPQLMSGKLRVRDAETAAEAVV